MSPSRFRILHLSDLHIGDRPEVVGLVDWGYGEEGFARELFSPTSHSEDKLEAVARLAYYRRADIDLVVISGDLATSGSEEDLQAAWWFLFGRGGTAFRAEDGGASLSPTGLGVAIVPGNHDRYSGSSHAPGGRIFDRVFSPLWAAGHAIQELATLGDIEDRNRLTLLGADFCLRDQLDATDILVGARGQGRVYPDILEELSDATAQAKKDSAVVWVVHFPPFFRPDAPNLCLVLEEELVRQASDDGVRHILCGHRHESRVYPAPRGAVTIHAAGTATHCAAPQNSVHLIEFSVRGSSVIGVSHEDFFWVPGDEDFGL